MVSKKLLTAELIGLPCTIVNSSNKDQIGLAGRVTDESRNTLTLEVGGKEKTVAKDSCTFQFQTPEGLQKMEGRLLVGRPEDRIKKNSSV